MRKLLGLLLLPALATASGGTEVTWLGGTQPYDTVPYLEADPKLGFSAGSGAPQLNAELDLGLTDWWMLNGRWEQDQNGSPERWRGGTRLKLFPQPLGGFGAAAIAGWQTGRYSASTHKDEGLYYGAVLAWEGAGQSFAVNATYNSVVGLQGSAAYWGPYLLFALRPGFEVLNGDREIAWVPQLACNLPGDLSIDLAYRASRTSEGAESWRILTRLSYQLFPNP